MAEVLETARDLYALPPEAFTAARNRLAKELKSAGNADDAAIVAKLRRPRLAEWALNRLSREDTDVVGRLATAIVEAQRAQSAAIGGDAADLREATNELRRSTSAATDAAVRMLSSDGGNGEAQRNDLTAILRELIGAADPAPLIAGVIGSEALVTSGEFFPGAPDPGPRRHLSAVPQSTDATVHPPSKDSDAPDTERPTRAPSRAKASSEAAKRAVARAERLRLQQEVKAADAALRAANNAVDEAAAELARRKAELRRATAAARSANADLDAFTGAD
jgi:hypothetical protein